MSTPKRTGENLNLWISQKHADALRVFLDRTRPRTTKTAIVEDALEMFLRAKGDWPDDDEDDTSG